MGSTSRRGDKDGSERGARASIAVDVFLVWKPRAEMSWFEPRGVNVSAGCRQRNFRSVKRSRV